MSCRSCQSVNQKEFSAEINMHFPGFEGLSVPTVWIFPTLSVCMDCGLAQFTIPDRERTALASRDWRNRSSEAAAS